MVMKGFDVENVAGGTWGVVEVLSGTGTMVGAVRVGGGTVDVASSIGGAGACGIESVECSSYGASSACGASSAYGGFATSTE